MLQPILSSRAQVTAKVLAVICKVVAVVLPTWVTFIWLLPIEGVVSAVASQTGAASMDWFTLPVRIGASLIALSTTAILATGLFRLANFFEFCASDDLRSPKALVGFRDFGFLLAVEAFVGPIQRGALEAYLTATAPDTQGRLSLYFGSDELTQLFIAALIGYVGFLLHRWRRTQAELDTFI